MIEDLHVERFARGAYMAGVLLVHTHPSDPMASLWNHGAGRPMRAVSWVLLDDNGALYLTLSFASGIPPTVMGYLQARKDALLEQLDQEYMRRVRGEPRTGAFQ